MERPSFDRLYAALVARSDEFDGLYFTAVKTTKIFCRPTCPARTPFAKNVEFLDSAKACLEAGYRACKRCKPLDMERSSPGWMAELVARLEKSPEVRLKDQDLREMGLEPVAVRRAFVKKHGMSFHAFQRSWRMGQALGCLREGGDAVDAAIGVGYQSDSGFREAFSRIIGTPARLSGDALPAWAKWIETPLGSMLAIATDEGLGLLEFVDRRMLETQLKIYQRRWQRPILPGKHPILDQITSELESYFAGELRDFAVPVAVPGTAFQESVWKALLTIPYGTTTTYAHQATMIGNPAAVRAVAKANGDNRISIVIPCHRVIATGGALCGYGGGLWRKQALLNLESGQAKLL